MQIMVQHVTGVANVQRFVDVEEWAGFRPYPASMTDVIVVPPGTPGALLGTFVSPSEGAGAQIVNVMAGHEHLPGRRAPSYAAPATPAVKSPTRTTPARLAEVERLRDAGHLTDDEIRRFAPDGVVNDEAWAALPSDTRGADVMRHESAEDALRRRRAHASATRAREAVSRATTAAMAREELIRQVEVLVPQALDALRRAGWPGGMLRRVPGRFRTKEIAGWQVGGFRFRGKPDGSAGRFNELYLLSDGHWQYGLGAKPRSFRDIVDNFAGASGRPGSLLDDELPEGVLERLRELAGARRT